MVCRRLADACRFDAISAANFLVSATPLPMLRELVTPYAPQADKSEI